MPGGAHYLRVLNLTPIGVVTSHHALVGLARLQKGESVLITAATGGIGQAVIQVAQDIGADIYATVGSDAKKQLPMDVYNIPKDHIFYSRDLIFVQAIKRLLLKGVDVVLNSLSGEKLTAVWSTIAPFRRFVEIGKRDIHSHQALLMFHFARNVSFFAVDIAGMIKERPRMAGGVLKETLNNPVLNMPKLVHVSPTWVRYASKFDSKTQLWSVTMFHVYTQY